MEAEKKANGCHKGNPRQAVARADPPLWKCQGMAVCHSVGRTAQLGNKTPSNVGCGINDYGPGCSGWSRGKPTRGRRAARSRICSLRQSHMVRWRLGGWKPSEWVRYEEIQACRVDRKTFDNYSPECIVIIRRSNWGIPCQSHSKCAHRSAKCSRWRITSPPIHIYL
jgi:hypothetical protein